MRGYWTGEMDWLLDEDWVCEICGARSLTWGMIHAQCRCDTCHAEYWMRDCDKEDNPRVTQPIRTIKPEYLDAARRMWEKMKRPIDEITESEWVEELREQS